MNQHERGALVFRQVAFPVAAFDYLKDYQRGYEKAHGVRITNNQALAMILAEHQQMNGESEEHGKHNNTPVLQAR